MAEIKETPLTSIHKEHGAKIVPFAGYAMPIQYTGVIAEHGFVRNHAGMFDVSHMGHCTVTGDTVSHLLSRPLSKIPEGKSRYLLIMNEKGGIIDDCIAYRTSVNTWHIVLNASRKEIDLDVLQDAVPRTDLAMIAVQGPSVHEILGDICPKRGFAQNAEVLGHTVELTAGTGYTGENGFEFIVHEDSAASLWNALLDKGISPCGLGSRDLLRIEAGLPLYGNDIDEETTPYETGLEFALDLDRTDFIAKNALEANPGSRRRAGITMKKGPVPRHGYKILSETGAEIGKVTSGTFSPITDCGIALVSIEKDIQAAQIEIRNKPCPVTEVPLPFYRRKK